MASDSGRRHEGKEAVLRLMSGGVGLYDAESPMEIEREAIAATGDHVFVEMTMNARTGQGQPYTNHYVFVFRMRDGLIVEVHEHLDTLYAQRKLFDPIGQRSPMDTTAEGS
jgi:ketosteroid isomerase-like protein